MIIKEYNNGWGSDVPLKQFESKILEQYLRPWRDDASKTVIVNSTWYNQQFHSQVCEQLSVNTPDRIVLTAMLDAAIVQPSWFADMGCEVYSVGYYRGPCTIDFWALAMDQYFQPVDFDCFRSDLIDCAFMSLNRKPHWHRRKLYDSLCKLHLVDQGLVSMGGENGTAIRKLHIDQGISNLAPNANTDQHGIANDIMSLGDQQNWQRHFLNIVSETWWDLEKNYFVSEKIYKPILGQRPFLVYAKNGARDWLTQQGFMHYCEDFKDISDLDLCQPENIPEFLKTLCGMPKLYWQSKFIALKDKIMYNSNNFKSYVSQIKNKIAKGITCQI